MHPAPRPRPRWLLITRIFGFGTRVSDPAPFVCAPREALASSTTTNRARETTAGSVHCSARGFLQRALTKD